MRETALVGPGDVRLRHVPEPGITDPGDAVVRVTTAGICGSDLWAFNGVAQREHAQPIGHEFVGRVVEVGSRVTDLRPGDEVVSPFSWSCASCLSCRAGWTSSCASGGFFGRTRGSSGAQSDFVRVPHADATLVRLAPGTLGGDRVLSVLLCGDVLATGHHAVRLAEVRPGDRCIVLGDGSVGLAAAMMARRTGAAHVTVVGHHEDRLALAADAHQVVQAADGSRDWLRELPRERVDAVMDCVGTAKSTTAAVELVGDGGRVAVVGVPHGVREAPVAEMFRRNIGLRYGITPARRYLPELLDAVQREGLDCSRLVSRVMSLDDVAEGYGSMSERKSLKVALVTT